MPSPIGFGTVGLLGGGAGGIGGLAGVGALATGPYGAAALAGISFAKFLTKLVAPPRGDLQKFHRVLYPVLVQKAAESGAPARCLWFGEDIVVTPDGVVDKVSNAGAGVSAAAARAQWAAEAKAGAYFFALNCDGFNFAMATPERVSAGCRFEQYGSAGLVDRIFGAGGGGDSLYGQQPGGTNPIFRNAGVLPTGGFAGLSSDTVMLLAGGALLLLFVTWRS